VHCSDRLLALARLLQMSSQAMPIGGYSHSQGLESAIEQEIVVDEASTLRWIGAVLEYSMMSYEVPWLWSMGTAWALGDRRAVMDLNDEFLASRESAELRAAGLQMGHSLRALLKVLPDFPADTLATLGAIEEPSLPCAWSAASTAWHIEPRDAAVGYLWTWAENQVLVALKAVPLGQSAGQRVLLSMGSRIAQFAATTALRTDACSNFAPGLAILSSQHETQYSRLFRS
jgi:urease accessory protein